MTKVTLSPRGNMLDGKLVPDGTIADLFGSPETDDEWQNHIDQDNAEDEHVG